MKSIILNGDNLSYLDVCDIAYNRCKVEISEEAEERIKKSRALLFKMADEGYPVYGLNRGVGWNKDKYVFSEFFQQYNENLIHAHCVAVGPEASVPEVRAMMVARFNTALVGSSGLAPEIIHAFRDFLNEDLVPVVPRRGSVGQGDISTLSHIGLAMMGEGEVIYQGVRMQASEALEKAGLQKAVLGPKDGLGILSSNAHSAGLAAMLVKETEEIIKISNLVYCLGMEGLNGKVEALDERVNAARKYEGQIQCAAECRKFLEGSYLNEPSKERALQDALCYRGGFAINGAVLDALNYLKNLLHIQLNTTDDNPCILYDDKELKVSTNFEATTWVLALEMLGIGLSHFSKNCCYRTIKLADPSFTRLSRFLTPAEGDVIAYGTIQKTFTSLDTENRMLANPSSMDYFAVAGNIEDHANNSPLAVDKISRIVDNLRYIIGIELLHAAQAIDLRKPSKMGVYTKKAYDLIRSEIPFLDKDRCLTIDIKKAYDLIESGRLLKILD
ncbi:MAG: aromatic amino acid lyase [Tissierellales bacterium]|nr:aromatic amino acid lyase [Tissierellales bacterium]MBN2828576.1 aromatic amino acid lyase [Tissierellales bacterium]